MQQEFWYCHSVALQHAERFLPETAWDDCATDFRLHIRCKAGSDCRLTFWFENSPAFINHCARQYILDCAKKLMHRREVSTCLRFDDEFDLTERNTLTVATFRKIRSTAKSSGFKRGLKPVSISGKPN